MAPSPVGEARTSEVAEPRPDSGLWPSADARSESGPADSDAAVVTQTRDCRVTCPTRAGVWPDDGYLPGPVCSCKGPAITATEKL